MREPAAVVMSTGMSSCAARRSREDQAARGSGLRCLSTAAWSPGRACGRAPRPRRPSRRRLPRTPPRRWPKGRSSACWRAWPWRAPLRHDRPQTTREETQR